MSEVDPSSGGDQLNIADEQADPGPEEIDDASSDQKLGDQPGEVADTAKAPRQKRTRSARSFPASSFFEALPIAEAIQHHAAGQKVRRLTLFESLKRSADSGPSRALVTNSAQYGLTKGSYSAEYLELTEKGRLATSDDSLGRTKMAAQLELSIGGILPFKAIYDQFSGSRLPALTVLRDFVGEQGVPNEHADECVETFLVNSRDLKLIRNYAGAERLLTFEILLEEIEQGSAYEEEVDEANGVEDTTRYGERQDRTSRVAVKERSTTSQVIAETTNLSDVCFVISPIGSEGSENRLHANLMLGSIIEPAISGLGLRLVRADRISKPGIITAQVIDHIVKAPLVIADLSFGNPNVFYELALRHASRKPIVQIIRSSDPLPFDVGQFRTVVMDMTNIYSLVPQIDSYRAEIARQCRLAIDHVGQAESPLSLLYPEFWDRIAD